MSDTIDDNRYALIYLNQQNQIKSVPITFHETEEGNFWSFIVSEKYIIIGLIWGYAPFCGDAVVWNEYMPLSPIEKYLFNASNVNFEIPKDAYRTANQLIEFNDLPK